MLYMLDKRLVRYDCWVRSAEAMLLLYLMPLAALETIATKKGRPKSSLFFILVFDIEAIC